MSDLPNNAPIPRVDEIRAVTIAYFGLNRKDMQSPCRKRAIAWPRMMAMALTREMTNLSLPKIGAVYGGRDHTTVLHACRRMRQLEAEDNGVALDMSRLRQAVFRLVEPDKGKRPAPLMAEQFISSIAGNAPALAAIFGMEKADKMIQRPIRKAQILVRGAA